MAAVTYTRPPRSSAHAPLSISHAISRKQARIVEQTPAWPRRSQRSRGQAQNFLIPNVGQAIEKLGEFRDGQLTQGVSRLFDPMLPRAHSSRKSSGWLTKRPCSLIIDFTAERRVLIVPADDGHAAFAAFASISSTLLLAFSNDGAANAAL